MGFHVPFSKQTDRQLPGGLVVWNNDNILKIIQLQVKFQGLYCATVSKNGFFFDV